MAVKKQYDGPEYMTYQVTEVIVTGGRDFLHKYKKWRVHEDIIPAHVGGLSHVPGKYFRAFFKPADADRIVKWLESEGVKRNTKLF